MRGACVTCGLPLRTREPDTGFGMYISAAIITGLFLIGLLWIFPTPSNPRLGQMIVGATALTVFFLSSQFRKGLAIALDYLVDLRWNNHEGLKFRR